MKKKFMFTKDSSFTHVKSEIHKEVTEHIVQDDETKKLYHHVVSYGSWFRITYESIFMSHLLKKIGITGFGVAYSADDCEIDLPCYPYHKPKRKSVVEIPEFIELKDIDFGRSKSEESEKFKQTFMGKTYKKKHEIGFVYDITSEDLLKHLFSCFPFYFGTAKEEDKVYPLYCILYRCSLKKKDELKKYLKYTDIGEYPEIRQILEKFVEIDIEKAIKIFEDEIETEFEDLKKDLTERQEIIKDYLSKYLISEVKEI